MVRGFYRRLAIVFLFVIGLSFFVASVTILPAYFVSSIKKNLAYAKLENQKKEPVPLLDQETLTDIKNLREKLSLIENAEQVKFNVSTKVINEIILHKTPNIKITEIVYNSPLFSDKNHQTDSKIIVSGVAPSREVLLSFRLALEGDVLFKKVDLPISNFVEGSNIPFYLNLTPA